MESHSMGVIIALVCLVIMSAYFSATETAFSSLNRIRIKNSANDGSSKAKLVLKLSENFDSLLSTILIGNNIVNIGMTALATVLFVNLYGTEVGASVATVVITVVVLVFGEISPKSLAKENPETFAMFSAPIISVLLVILAPVNFLFTQWKKFLGRFFKLGESRTITEQELITIVEEAKTEGGIAQEQSELIQNAIEFNELEAWDVLTPRVDVEAIEIDEEKAEIALLFVETGFSRLPVYDESIDKIMGVLNQKDFHNYIYNTEKSISEYVKPVVFVAGSVKIASLLKKMQKVNTHIAVVVDEYGGTAGIVTMEDIIEELVGEIFDEHDEITSQEIIQLYDQSYRILCGTNFEKMVSYFKLENDSAIDVSTVNGWVVVMLDKLPEVGDFFEYQNLKVRVTKADDKKALEINVTVIPIPEEEDQNVKNKSMSKLKEYKEQKDLDKKGQNEQKEIVN